MRLELLADRPDGLLSQCEAQPRVAKRAGVTRPAVYMHFPTAGFAGDAVPQPGEPEAFAARLREVLSEEA
jgi:hypothetical protein